MESQLILFLFVGFVAQLIDGCLGMAYGVSANSFLLGIGVLPAAASASVHASEVFTTAFSGISHWRLGNIDWGLVRRLLIPGVLGGVAGAYLLTRVPGELVKPYIAVYLLLMGARILYKSLGEMKTAHLPLAPLGLAGGFFDAIGGGGWGPIVTTTLLANGSTPRKTIGSVNLSEFFVTLVQTFTFLATIGLQHWQVILGLIIGGAIAAPFGALLTSRLPARILMRIVGVLIILLSIRTLLL